MHLARLFQTLDALWADTRGTIAVKFALALPVLAVVSLGAVNINAVHSEKALLQNIAPSLDINADDSGAVVPVPSSVSPQGGAVNLVA